MFMYINKSKVIYTHHLLFENNFYVTSLVIYAPKTLLIFHHVVNKSAQGEKANFEINCVILQKIQIRVCVPLPSNKYALYIGVDWLLG